MIVVWLWVLSQMNAPWWVVAVLIVTYSLRTYCGIINFVAKWGDNE